MPEHVTVSQLLDAREALERILSLELHPQTNHRLTRITKFLDEEKSLFIVVRDSLVRQYGEAEPTDPSAHHIKPGMTGWAKYAEALKPVLVEKVLFPFAKLDMKDLPALSPKEYIALEFMLITPEDPVAEEDQQLGLRAESRAAVRAAILAAAKEQTAA